MSEWFSGTPTFIDTPRQPVLREWACPVDGCTGKMVFNGHTWPTGDPGYHHTCTVCKGTLAIQGGRYPKMEFIAAGDPTPPAEPPRRVR